VKQRLFWIGYLALALGAGAVVVIPQVFSCRCAPDSVARSCIANLRQIDGAKEQWSVDKKRKPGADVSMRELVPKYLKTMPVCPAGGSYTPGRLGTPPLCSKAPIQPGGSWALDTEWGRRMVAAHPIAHRHWVDWF
jgi:hypothetical protein